MKKKIYKYPRCSKCDHVRAKHGVLGCYGGVSCSCKCLIFIEMKPLVKQKMKIISGEKYFSCNLCGKYKLAKEFDNNSLKKILIACRCKACSKLKHFTQAYRLSHKRSRLKYPLKEMARAKVNYALKMGKIKKPSFCEKCKTAHNRIEGHHFDYAKPLNVLWVCPPCHHQVHHA